MHVVKPASLSRVSLICDSIDIGIVVINQAQQVIEWNTWMEKYSGYSSEVALGQSLKGIFSELENSRIQLGIETALQHDMAVLISQRIHKSPFPLFENHVAREKNERIYQHVEIKPYINDENERCCLVQIRDVTSASLREQTLRQKAVKIESLESDLHNSVNQLQIVLENANEGIVTTDEFGELISCNRRALVLLSSAYHQTVGKNITDYFVDHHNKLSSNWFSSPQTLVGTQLFLKVKRDDDSCIPVELSVHMTGINDKKCYIFMFNDISESIARENKEKTDLDDLGKAVRELDQFVYHVSHDLKEPLRMVSSYLGLLDKKFGSQMEVEAKEFLHHAIDGGKRMAGQIETLLEYSRLGSQNINFQSVDVGAVVKSVLGEYKSEIALGQIVFYVEERLPPVHADSSMVSLIFSEILSNALLHGGKTSITINISAEKKGKFWEFLIQDNGVGIDEKNIEDVFGLFNRINGSNGNYSAGLARCRKTVERIGGKIWVDSTMGYGSKFYFTLPVAKFA